MDVYHFIAIAVFLFSLLVLLKVWILKSLTKKQEEDMKKYKKLHTYKMTFLERVQELATLKGEDKNLYLHCGYAVLFLMEDKIKRTKEQIQKAAIYTSPTSVELYENIASDLDTYLKYKEQIGE